jgi:integrase
MATFKTVLDTRVKKKDEKYNLAMRVSNGSDIMYINLQKMTVKQYEKVFVKKSMDLESIKFRETCDQYKSKCERIFNQVKPYDKSTFRKLFWEKETTESLLLKDLFEIFLTNYENIKLKTRTHFRGTLNVFETYQKGLSVLDITPAFLRKFEKSKIADGWSRATVDSNLRNLRRIINYFRNEVKLIPESYIYPFGKGSFSISSYFPAKIVLKESEIQAVTDMTEFDTPEQEYSRDVFLMSYYCNGCNFVDLLKMKWNQIIGDYILFMRKKTESTRKNNIKNIVVPLNENLKSLIDKVGDKTSPFLLGLMKEGYTESAFENKNHKIKQQINRNLTAISKKLNLSVPLNLSKARDCYASTLMRKKISRDEIGQMLGHSNAIVTEHYLSSIDAEKTFEINSVLLKKNKPGSGPEIQKM